MTWSNALPETVIRRIFGQLDFESRRNARLVCKNWNKLMNRFYLRIEEFELNDNTWDTFLCHTHLPFNKINVENFEKPWPVLGVQDIIVRELVFNLGELTYRNLISILKISQHNLKTLTFKVNMNRDKWIGLVGWKGIMSLPKLRKLIICDQIIERERDRECICQFRCQLDCIVCISHPTSCSLATQVLDHHQTFMRNLRNLKMPSLQVFKWIVDYRNKNLQSKMIELKPFFKEFVNFFGQHQPEMHRAEIHLWCGGNGKTIIKARPRIVANGHHLDSLNYNNEVRENLNIPTFKVKDVDDHVGSSVACHMPYGVYDETGCKVYFGRKDKLQNLLMETAFEVSHQQSSLDDSFLQEDLSHDEDNNNDDDNDDGNIMDDDGDDDDEGLPYWPTQLQDWLELTNGMEELDPNCESLKFNPYATEFVPHFNNHISDFW